MRGRRFLSVLLALVIVSQVAVAPVSAAGPDDDAECFLRSQASILTLGAVESCETPAQDAAETRADVYAGALQAKDLGKFTRTITANDINASKSHVWCKGKAVAIEELKNGSTEAQALDAVNQTVDDYWAATQWNVAEAWEAQSAYMYYLANTSKNAGLQNTGSTSSDLLMAADGNRGDGTVDDYAQNVFEPKNKTVKLLNGTNLTTKLYVYEYTYSGSDIIDGIYDPIAPDTYTTTDGSSSYDPRFTAGNDSLKETGANKFYMEARLVESLDYSLSNDKSNLGTSNTIKLLDTNEWYTTWHDINEAHQLSKQNLAGYVRDLYATYNASDFEDGTAAELQSACSLATLRTDDDTTGGYAWRRAAVALSDIESDVNASFTIEYTPNDPMSYQGDTTLSGSDLGVTFDDPTYGDGAVLTGTEAIRFDLNTTANLTSVEFRGDDGTAFAVSARNVSGDTWKATLVGSNISTLSDAQTFNASVVATTDQNDTVEFKMGTITYAPNGTASIEMSGGLYTKWAPSKTNGSFVVGETYDTANATSSVLFVETLPGDSKNRYLDGTFKIVDLRDPETGEQLNSTTLEDDARVTTNASSTQEEIEEILKWKEQFEQNYDPTGGGGGIDLGGVLPAIPGIGLVVLAGGALLLLSRD